MIAILIIIINYHKVRLKHRIVTPLCTHIVNVKPTHILFRVVLTSRCCALTNRCCILTIRCCVLTRRCRVLTSRYCVLTIRCCVLTRKCHVLTSRCRVLTRSCCVLTRRCEWFRILGGRWLLKFFCVCFRVFWSLCGWGRECEEGKSLSCWSGGKCQKYMLGALVLTD